MAKHRRTVPARGVTALTAAWLAVAIAACGSSGGSGSADPAPSEPPEDAPLLPAPAANEGIQLTIDGFEVPAGGEITEELPWPAKAQARRVGLLVADVA